MAWYIDWSSPKTAGASMEHFRQYGWYRLNLGDPETRTPHAQGNFPTASGKCEFFSQGAADNGKVVWSSCARSRSGWPRSAACPVAGNPGRSRPRTRSATRSRPAPSVRRCRPRAIREIPRG